jgi:hypothetical protein
MSILLVEIVPEGIIFGADRNVTFSSVITKRKNKDNCTILEYNNIIYGQSQAPKVLRWPNRKALIGYVGAASIGGLPTHEWLYEFIGKNINFTDFEELSELLRREIENQMRKDQKGKEPESLLIHIGGFEEHQGIEMPVIWFVRNVWAYEEDYTDIREEYQKSEEFLSVYSNNSHSDIKNILKQRASNYDPFWFHQGLNLRTFNNIERFLKAAFKNLCDNVEEYSIPNNLSDWEAQVRMSILTYSAYFQAFKGPSEQFVGGGVDIVSIAWPT